MDRDKADQLPTSQVSPQKAPTDFILSAFFSPNFCVCNTFPIVIPKNKSSLRICTCIYIQILEENWIVAYANFASHCFESNMLPWHDFLWGFVFRDHFVQRVMLVLLMFGLYIWGVECGWFFLCVCIPCWCAFSNLLFYIYQWRLLEMGDWKCKETGLGMEKNSSS